MARTNDVSTSLFSLGLGVNAKKSAATQVNRKRKAPPPQPEVDQQEVEPKMWKRSRSSRVANKLAALADEIPTPADSTPDTDDAPVTPGIKGRDADFGTSTAIKTFYEGKNSHSGHYNWVETPPKQLNEKIAKANNRVAIKIYKIKDHEQPTINGKTPLKIHEVELQSAILVAALKDIVRDEGLYLESTEVAKFQTPFKPLFFSYDKIMALVEKTKANGLLKEHLQLLVQVMEQMFGGFMAHLKNLNASGLISYKLAWTYFPKDTMLYCGTRDCERVCRVISTNYVIHPAPAMNIACEEIAFDGETFAWKPLSLAIPAFGGNLPVTDLPYYPLSFHEDEGGVKARLTVRAKKALEYQELTYCEYSGVALKVTGCGMQRHNVSKTCCRT